MTSQQKAGAWLWAARLIESECEAMCKRSELRLERSHAMNVIAPMLRRIAKRVAGSTKAKRESDK